jgi:TPR repeat protein
VKYILLLSVLLASTAFAAPSIEETMIEAKQGVAYAQYNLGLIYFKGEGVPKNDAEAVKWFRKAADQGHATAQFNQGLMYASGIGGVPENDAEAVKWFRKAADQGHAKAQFNLGVRYGNVRGIPKNYAEAVKWFRKAAEATGASVFASS